MSQAKPVNYSATETAGASFSHAWKAREVAYALVAIAIITAASWALHDPASLSKVIHFDMSSISPTALKCLLSVGVILGFRTLIWRPGLGTAAHRFVYMINGRYSYAENTVKPQDPSWDNATPFELQASDGKKISGHIVESIGPKRGVIIHTLGNAVLYDAERAPQRQEGYDLIFYHPPGYGSSDGPRNPESDFYALEGVLHYMNKQRNVPYECMHLKCQSIGSGPGIEVAAHYQLAKLQLIVPLAHIEDVGERFATVHTHWVIGKIAQLFLGGVTKDYFGYDNTGNLAKTRAPHVLIEEAEKDDLMTLSDAPTEASKLIRAWQSARVFENKEMLTDVTGARLELRRWLGRGHNDVPVF